MQVCVIQLTAGWLFQISNKTITQCMACRVAPSTSLLLRPLIRLAAATVSLESWKQTVSSFSSNLNLFLSSWFDSVRHMKSTEIVCSSLFHFSAFLYNSYSIQQKCILKSLSHTLLTYMEAPKFWGSMNNLEKDTKRSTIYFCFLKVSIPC